MLFILIFYNGCLHVNLLFTVEVMVYDIEKDDQLELILAMSSQDPIAISDSTCCFTGRVTTGCSLITPHPPWQTFCLFCEFGS
jgi:hypothetical protein